jgi:hypothetical protein
VVEVEVHVAYLHMAHGSRRHDLPSVTPNNPTSVLFADGHDVELWQLDRKVATFPKVLKKG